MTVHENGFDRQAKPNLRADGPGTVSVQGDGGARIFGIVPPARGLAGSWRPKDFQAALIRFRKAFAARDKTLFEMIMEPLPARAVKGATARRNPTNFRLNVAKSEIWGIVTMESMRIGMDEY